MELDGLSLWHLQIHKTHCWSNRNNVMENAICTQSFVEYIFIHSLVFHASPSIRGYSSDKSPVYRRATWKYQQTFTLMLPHTDKLEFQIRFMHMSLDCSRKSEYLVRTHTDPRWTCKGFWSVDETPLGSCCEATGLTTAPPCRPATSILQ